MITLKKNLFILILIIITFALLLTIYLSKGSYKGPSEAPEIDIIISNSDPATSYSEIVESIILLNQWNGAKYDRLSSMQAINDKYTDEEPVPLGKVGQKVIIDFGPNKPDTVKLTKQYRVSNDDVEHSIPTEVDLIREKPTIFSYELPENDVDALTHQYVFTLTVTWGHNSTDYSFCIDVQNNEDK